MLTAMEAKMHHYAVTKTTTDKMEAEIEATCNDPGWELYQATYVGGRDWVLIFHDYCPESDEDLEYERSDAAKVAEQIQRAVSEAARVHGGAR